MTLQDLIGFAEAEQLDPSEVQIVLGFADRIMNVTTLEGSAVQEMYSHNPNQMFVLVPTWRSFG